MIYSWDDLQTSDCSDTLNDEKSANAEINFQIDAPISENDFVFVIGIAICLIDIDGAGRVSIYSTFDFELYKIWCSLFH